MHEFLHPVQFFLNHVDREEVSSSLSSCSGSCTSADTDKQTILGVPTTLPDPYGLVEGNSEKFATVVLELTTSLLQCIGMELTVCFAIFRTDRIPLISADVITCG